MLAVVSLLTVVTLSLLVTRVATIALTHTGLSQTSARFQARSAFTGVGFTTSESEKVVNHPVRRRVLMMLMLLGNAGIVTAVSSLILTFVRDEPGGLSAGARAALLVGGLLLLWRLSSSQWVDRRLCLVIDKGLRRMTGLDVRDYASLLRLTGEYRVSELQVCEQDWIASGTLAELALRDEGVVVLGIQRADGEYLGSPRGEARARPGDVLVLYGRAQALVELDERRAGWTGDARHEAAVAEQERAEAEELSRDEAAEPAT